SNGIVTANNIICDGGSNFTSLVQSRQNAIIMNQTLLVVTNKISAAPGLPLDTLQMTASTLSLKVIAGQTNVYVKTLLNLGSTPSVIKIASATGTTVYPTNIPLISYEAASPFLTADMTSSGLTGVQGYIINNGADK